jgi:hypothetical protein
LLDQSFVSRVAAIARENGWTQEEAQARLAAAEKETLEVRKANIERWNAELKAHKELGGENFETTMAQAGRYSAWLKERYPTVLAEIERYGLSSRPDFAKFLSDQGQKMAEDRHVPDGGAPKPKPKTYEEKAYGKTTPGPKQRAA